MPVCRMAVAAIRQTIRQIAPRGASCRHRAAWRLVQAFAPWLDDRQAQKLIDEFLKPGGGNWFGRATDAQEFSSASASCPAKLTIVVRRSDHAHALISSISTSAAAEMPGVFAIYTAQDLDDLVEPVRASSRMKDYHATALYPLARGKVRYVGEPVVAILAANRYLAEDALDRIEIAYEPLGTVIDPGMAVREDAPLLHEEAGTNVLAMREFARGDVGATMATAPVRVGGRFRFHRKAPIAIENRACLAEYDRGRRSLTFTGSTQIPGPSRRSPQRAGT
jgi:CO/xanthine dehydrogenase Mo-binding subunit